MNIFRESRLLQHTDDSEMRHLMARVIQLVKRTNVSLRPFNSGNLELVKLLFPAIKVCSEQKNKQRTGTK